MFLPVYEISAKDRLKARRRGESDTHTHRKKWRIDTVKSQRKHFERKKETLKREGESDKLGKMKA